MNMPATAAAADQFLVLGFRPAAAAALSLLLSILGFLMVITGARRRWRIEAERRRARVERLALVASWEAAEAETEMEELVHSSAAVEIAGGGPPSLPLQPTPTPPPMPTPPPKVDADVELARLCAVCSRPTTTRCSRCKAVKYCSGKCQISHWRKGHKDVCSPHMNGSFSYKSDKIPELSRECSRSMGSNNKLSDERVESSAGAEVFNSHIESKIFSESKNHGSSMGASTFAGSQELEEENIANNKELRPLATTEGESTDRSTDDRYMSRREVNVERPSKNVSGKVVNLVLSKTIDELKSSNYPRKYPSEFGNDVSGKYKMLFPYDLFVKLYNSERMGFTPCGLMNCGNSCYANVVIQCLTFTRPLTAYLLQGLHRRSCRMEEWCFTCDLSSLLLEAKLGKSPLSPMQILSHIGKIGNNMVPGSEEDAHEFLRHVLETMQSICLKEAGDRVACVQVEETTLVQLTFGGYLQSKVKCTKCKIRSIQNERMLDLTVEILGDVGTLEESLKRFTSYEVLDGENKYQCSRCKSYERAKKKLTILEAPNILTIALKRFESGKFGKLNKAVRFPEYLDLAPYMSGTQDKSPVYQLYAVVVHRGSMNSAFTGHYICYVKNAEGKWYRINDSTVKQVELNNVLEEAAYMLFYARCSPRAPSLIRSSTKTSKSSTSTTIDRTAETNMARGRADNSSDKSSLFSYSDEGSSSSTESTRESTSTGFSEYIFGGPQVSYSNTTNLAYNNDRELFIDDVDMSRNTDWFNPFQERSSELVRRTTSARTDQTFH